MFKESRRKVRERIAELDDIKIFLLLGYAFGFLVAIYPPILIDPRLSSHAQYGARVYPYVWLCGPIYLLLMISEIAYLSRKLTTELSLYLSVVNIYYFYCNNNSNFFAARIPSR
jgi:hypothetical protein